jgi:hypothetical protein
MTVRYTRVYADEAGESHYEEVGPELTTRDYAPPAPPFDLSAAVPAAGAAFARFPAGWVGDWHPTPRRQFFVFLSGAFAGETSDGDRRDHAPGSVVLLEDTTGKGHRAWVAGDDAVVAMVVQLPD